MKKKSTLSGPVDASGEPAERLIENWTDEEIAAERVVFEAFMRRRNLSPEVFAMVCPWVAAAVPSSPAQEDRPFDFRYVEPSSPVADSIRQALKELKAIAQTHRSADTSERMFQCLAVIDAALSAPSPSAGANRPDADGYDLLHGNRKKV